MAEEKDWSAAQLSFISWLADPRREGTQEQFAATIGVRPETLSRWKDLDGFAEAVYQRTVRHLGLSLPRVLHALALKAERGDVPAIKLLLEHLGKFTPKQEVGGGIVILPAVRDSETKGLTIVVDRGEGQ